MLKNTWNSFLIQIPPFCKQPAFARVTGCCLFQWPGFSYYAGTGVAAGDPGRAGSNRSPPVDRRTLRIKSGWNLGHGFELFFLAARKVKWWIKGKPSGMGCLITTFHWKLEQVQIIFCICKGTFLGRHWKEYSISCRRHSRRSGRRLMQFKRECKFRQWAKGRNTSTAKWAKKKSARYKCTSNLLIAYME